MSVLGLVLSALIGFALGFFGGGGSILTVPLLVYVFGLDVKPAIASSLLIVAAASVSGALQHWRAGNLEVRTGLTFGAAGVAGAYLGGRAAAFVDAALLLLLFATMMVLTAVSLWQGRRPAVSRAGTGTDAGRLLAQGFAVGLFTGLVGAGGGFLIVPALALWAGLPMASAVGTSLFIIVLKSLAAFSGYLRHVQVDYPLVAAVAAAAIPGVLLGAVLARRMDPASLRRAFAGFVLAMALVIAAREGESWVTAAAASLPSSIPQALFALIMLSIGIATGRASRRAGGAPLAESLYDKGGGI